MELSFSSFDSPSASDESERSRIEAAVKELIEKEEKVAERLSKEEHW